MNSFGNLHNNSNMRDTEQKVSSIFDETPSQQIPTYYQHMAQFNSGPFKTAELVEVLTVAEEPIDSIVQYIVPDSQPFSQPVAQPVAQPVVPVAQPVAQPGVQFMGKATGFKFGHIKQHVVQPVDPVDPVAQPFKTTGFTFGPITKHPETGQYMPIKSPCQGMTMHPSTINNINKTIDNNILKSRQEKQAQEEKNNMIEILYGELTTIRSQIEKLTKSTDNIYEILRKF